MFNNKDEQMEYDAWLMSHLYAQHQELSRFMGRDHIKFLRDAKKSSFKNRIVRFIDDLRGMR